MNLLDFQQKTEPEPESFEAVVADDASSFGELVRVIIPEFDRQLAHGPCLWTPVVTSAGIFWPKRGDSCTVVEPPMGRPVIVSWSPSATVPDQPIGATAGTGLKRSGAVLSADFGVGAGKVTEGNDSRLSNARTPTAYAASHAPDGTDPIVVPVVTSLPGSPFDGQEVYFNTGAGLWHFRYRSAASGSYKWEFLGGPALQGGTYSSRATTSTSFVDLPTDPIKITAPLSGEYDIEIQGFIQMATGNGVGRLSYSIGSTPADPAWGVSVYLPAGSYGINGAKTNRHTVAASDVIAEKARVDSSFTANFTNRVLRVTPVRVG